MRVLDHNPFSVQSFQNLSRFEAVAKPGFDVIEPSDYPARYGSGRIRHLVGCFHLRHISPEHSAGSGPASIENRRNKVAKDGGEKGDRTAPGSE